MHEHAAAEVQEEVAVAAPAAAGLAVAPSVASMLSLQRSAGNQAVLKLLRQVPAAAEEPVVPLNTAGEAADKDFTSKVGSKTVEAGQFVFWRDIMVAVQKAVGDVLTNEDWGPEFAADQEAAKNQFLWFAEHVGNKNYDAATQARWALARILKKSKAPKAADMLKRMGPDSASTKAAGQALWEKLWKQYSDPKAPYPDTSPYETLAHFQGLTRWAKIACYAAAERIAKKYAAAGGNGQGKRSKSTAMGRTQLSSSVGTGKKIEGANLTLGHIVSYRKDLEKVVQKMQAALDDGWVIHARVLSGTFGPGEEHSLVVYEYGGYEFDFFDPDVHGSNVENTGFDKLYYDSKANRLSTARNESELPVYIKDVGDRADGIIGGYQEKGMHRYQVLSVWTM